MTEHYHGLKDTWRAASRDEPPAALDDAIRAAARREVGAGPRRSRVQSWMPLAAAATIAALAVGIVEMIPRDELSPGMTSATVSAPTAANAPPDGLQKRAVPTADDALKAAAPPPAATPAQPSASPTRSERGGDAERRETAAKQYASPLQSPSLATPAAAPQAFPASPPADAALAAAPAAAAREQSAPVTRFEAAKPQANRLDEASRGVSSGQGGEARSLSDKKSSPSGGGAAETTPRAAAKLEIAQAPDRARQASEAAQPNAPATPQKMLDRLEEQARAARRDAAAARGFAEPLLAQPATPSPVEAPTGPRAAAPAPAAPPPYPAPSMTASPAAPAPPSVAGEARGNASQLARKTDPHTEDRDAAAVTQPGAAKPKDILAHAQDTPARPADEWIKLIQRLRYDGKIAEAAKELAAFRDAYKERADALLPRDLRDIKP